MLSSYNRTPTALFLLSVCLLFTEAYSNSEPQVRSEDHINEHDRTIRRREKRQSTQNKGSEDFLFNTPGCKIPNFMKTIKYKESKNLERSCGQRAIFVSKVSEDKLVFQIDEGKLRRYVKGGEYECCYSLAARSKDNQNSYSKCIKFRDGTNIKISHEVITVKCYKKERIWIERTILYDDAYIIIKRVDTNSTANNESWNVLLVGIDTMSRARMFSTMPKLAGHLLRQGWLDYIGYHKVGRNTFPNVSPLLTGKNSTTIKSLCENRMEKCNDLMLWSRYRKLGYITAFGEDYIYMDTFSRSYGFKTTPTHHYMRPLFVTGEAARGNLICTKHKSSVNHIFDYAHDFANTYKSRKFFGTFWINSICHDIEFLPSLHENDLINFINKISSTGALNNTFILLLGDHGAQYGPNRMQIEGYHDSRLPLLFIWVPTQFRNSHKEQYHNMQLNQQRLITPYDIYLTLAKIADMSLRSDIDLEACPTCNNIFEEKSLYRTCVMGGVKKWCGCHSLRKADAITDIDVLLAIQLAVSSIQNCNSTLRPDPWTKCREMHLDKVHRVHSFTNERNQTNYVISLQMVADNPRKVKRNLRIMSYEAVVLKRRDEFTVLLIEIITPYR